MSLALHAWTDRAGESAWNEALAYAVDRAFGFGLIPPTRMVRLDLDDMRRQLSAAATQRGETAAFIAGQMELVENWRSNAKENIKARWKRTKVGVLALCVRVCSSLTCSSAHCNVPVDRSTT